MLIRLKLPLNTTALKLTDTVAVIKIVVLSYTLFEYDKDTTAPLNAV
jgi:hypothetical protein